MPVGLDRVKASFQTGVSQATQVRGSRDEACGEVPNHTPPTLGALQGPWITKGSSEQKRELFFLPLQPKLPVLCTQGPDLMTAAKLPWAWVILQAWTFWGLCSDGSTGFPGLGGIRFLPLWASHFDPVAIHSPAPGLGESLGTRQADHDRLQGRGVRRWVCTQCRLRAGCTA